MFGADLVVPIPDLGFAFMWESGIGYKELQSF